MSDKKTEVESLKFRQIIFGRYCGECDGNCAPMFLLKLNNNESTLMADFDNTFFRSEKRFEFKTDLNQKQNLEIAREIAKNIPDTLYNWKTDEETFGCPDCTDGCGYYLEFKTESGKVKTFNLDWIKNDKILKEISDFTVFMAERINDLIKKSLIPDQSD